MNPVVDFLLEIRAKGVNVAVEGNQLRCTAPPGVLTADLREQLGAYKPELLRLLGDVSSAEEAAQSGAALNSATRHDTEPATHGLSRAQSAIWLLEQITPGTSIWNVPNAFRIQGPLDHGALEFSFRALVTRHAILRSRFITVDGLPAVEPAPLDQWSIDYVDLRSLPDAEQQAAARAMAEAQRPFNLEAELPCRVMLLQTADLTHLLVIVLHHIVADGWSLGIICRELSQVYEAHLLGTTAPLPPLRADYQAFIRQAQSDEAASQADLDWWQEKLSGEPPNASLAADSTRVPSGAGRRVVVEIEPSLTAGIERLARQHRATPFMVLLAAFKLLVHRYTAERDLLIAVASSGRDRPEYADIVGLFVNTLVLRTDVAPDLTFTALLDRVRETCVEAFRRQLVPFDRVVSATQPRRGQKSINPFTRLSFAFQNLPLTPLRLGTTELTHMPLGLPGARQELLIEIWRTSSGLSCEFEYATDLFDADTIARLMGHYRTLLAAIVAEPHRRISDLNFLTEAEREQLLTGWNNTRTDYASDRRLEALFAEHAARAPKAVALIHRNHEISYGELDRRANQLANHLRDLGVGPEVLVGICLERSPDLVVAILAVLKAGGGYLPLDPKYPGARLAFMLKDSAATLLITSSALRRLIAHTAQVVDLDFDRAAIANQPEAPPQTGATAENLAYVIYTSGSTGRPKGTMLRHSAVFLVDWACRTFSPEQISRVVAGTSICFDPSVLELFVPLCTGGTVILIENFLEPLNPATQPTALFTVPSVCNEFVRSGNLPGSVRLIVSGGEKLNNSVVQALYETTQVERIYNVYGPTEYTTCAVVALVARGAGQDPPIGRPLCNTQVYVLDPQRHLVPVGVVGELCLAGDGLARGYLGRPGLTAERFINNPFGPPGSRMYCTGDLVRWSPAGELEFIGRLDNQVKLRGFRIELGEIEASLLRHEAVRDAVVVARQDHEGNIRLVGYIVANGPAPSPAELRQHMERWLPSYMIPSAVVVLPAFPLNPSGKIDKAALPPPFMEQPEQAAAEQEHMPPIEETIVNTFKQVLAVDDVGMESNFFDLGGHSLLAIKVASNLTRLLAQPISPALIFQAPTPRLMAPMLSDGLTVATSHITPLQPLGDYPPLFCFHDLFSRPLSYLNLSRALPPDQPIYGVAPGPLQSALIANPTFEILTPAYIAAIKSIQPSGPYQIVGYSFGGVPAFDVARALCDAGEDVLLFMIDPYVYRTMPKLGDVVKWGRRQFTHLLKKIYEARKAWLKPRSMMKKIKGPGPILTSEDPLALALLQARADYQFRPFKGRTVFLQGTVRDPRMDLVNSDGLNGWSGLFDGELIRHSLPTDHYWIMREPLVSSVAGIIREHRCSRPPR